MTVKLGDIVKELRGNAVFALLLAAAWILSSVTYEQALDRREIARNIVAFLLMRDVFNGIHDDFKIDQGALTCFVKMKMEGRSEVPHCQPFSVAAPWNPSLRAAIRLIPERDLGSEIQVYRIEPSDDFLPFNRYRVGRYGDVWGIVQAFDYRAPRALTDALRLNDAILQRSPVSWQQLTPMLAALGHSGRSITDIRISDPAVGRLMIDYLSDQGVRETIAGLSVPIFLFPVGLGVLITLASLLLVVSWVSLRRAANDPPQEDVGWVYLQGGDGIAGHVTLVASVLLSVVLFLVPGMAISRVLDVVSKADPMQRIGLFALAASIILLSVVFLMNVLALFRLRRAMVATERALLAKRKADTAF